MDLRYSPDDLAFRDATRRWFEANVPTTELKTLGERREWHRTLFDGGYVGMGWPREYGGQDARALRQAIVADEMARVNAPPTINGLGIGIVGPTIIHHGTEAQKQRYLKKILGFGAVVDDGRSHDADAEAPKPRNSATSRRSWAS